MQVGYVVVEKAGKFFWRKREENSVLLFFFGTRSLKFKVLFF